MNVLDAIFTRKSIRKYTEPISEKELETLLRAGFAAPTAHNTQEWEFVVLKDPKVLQDIEDMHANAKMLTKAGLGILVCGNLELQTKRDFLLQDCAAALENMLLAAHGMGLGAVWLSITGAPEETYEGVKKYLGLPENIIPVGILVAAKKEMREILPRNRYLEERVHVDRW